MAIQCWDASKIKNDDKRRPFHNGLNEYVPDNAGKNYLDQRARAKGLTLTYENDHRKLRGTKVTPRKFVGG